MMRTEKMESKPNIIIVDDDNRVLTKFKKLLSNKAKYNVNAFVTALMWAVQNGHTEIAQMLKKAGAKE